MLKKTTQHRRKIAAFLLAVFASTFISPIHSWAITNGPAQPEMQGFSPISATDMVDLFSGDMKYNIPLMDVGGYPLNLSYNAGGGLDQEASWVGNGWTLNPGTVNRQMKALPDDFKGDEVKKSINLKPKQRINGSVQIKPDIVGFEKIAPSLSLRANVFKDNYYGWGAQLSLNAGIQPSFLGGKFSAGVGLTSSSMDGAGISPSFSYSYALAKNEMAEFGLGMNIGFSYNSRKGLLQQSMGASFNSTFMQKYTASAGVDYVDHGVATYTPGTEIPKNTEDITLSVDAGLEVFGFKGTFGVDGGFTKEFIPENKKIRNIPSYGYLYAHEKANEVKPEYLTDINREKDGPYFRGTPSIGIPVLTNDNFIATSQNGGGQYKIHRSSGVTHDPHVLTSSSSTSAGLSFAALFTFNGGGHYYTNKSITTSNKWVDGNAYKTAGDFKPQDMTNPAIEHAYFKKTGEFSETDNFNYSNLGGDKAVRVKTAVSGKALATPNFVSGNGTTAVNTMAPARRVKKVENFSYLTASEAARYGFDKEIKDHNVLHPESCYDLNSFNPIYRTTEYRRPHHISEISILDPQGKRTIYGIPVYNTKQVEVSFAVESPNDPAVVTSGLVDIAGRNTIGNTSGRDHYFSRDEIPPYATSFLLTAIVSADYRDVKNDGITDDDQGTAVKLNYKKLPGVYKWQTPYDPGKANYNEGLRSDIYDDKANYAYGEREVWYMHSVESKSVVAVFYTSARDDGYGVDQENGSIDASISLQKLDSIRLFSKPDFILHGSGAKPIKTVHFEYDYSTGVNLPNNINTGSASLNTGKLTLKKLWFTFGNNSGGVFTPYEFEYNNENAGPSYSHRMNDRWGSYKNNITDNPSPLTNYEFPYTVQDKVKADVNAAYWNLKRIVLPTGGQITIDYESDDYAYVQDKRACTMYQLKMIGANGGTPTTGSNFINANDYYITVPNVSVNATNAARLAQDLKFLYGKFYVTFYGDIKEYVPGYAEIESITPYQGTHFRVRIKKVVAEGTTGDMNPFAIASWQFLRNNLPQFAYPGYDNSTALQSQNLASNLKSIVLALKNAVANFTEIFENYNKKYKRFTYANTIDVSRSWIRLVSPEGKKLGGGHRVSKVSFNDNWGAMATGAGTSNTYGQIYEYTTTEGSNVISSGVASYEPGIGSDENPFKKPVFYSKEVKWGLDYNTYMEEPIGESYMPAPSVGYSKVTVKNFGASGVSSADKKGHTEHEFYTAKEFPTIIEKTGPPEEKEYNPKLSVTIIKSYHYSNVITSQGLVVIENDMHGKPKATKTYDKGKELISSEEVFYKVESAVAPVQRLSNEVDLLDKNGTVRKGVIGQDEEIITDMRYQETNSLGKRRSFYTGTAGVWIFSIFFAALNVGDNIDISVYNSTSTVKLIKRYGIVYKIKKTQNGSSSASENLLWDPETGNVLLTKTNNEFEKPVYSLNYPAHWQYEGMAGAYQNMNTVLDGISTSSTGVISATNSNVFNMLQPGDELIDLGGNNTYWVIQNATGSTLMLADQGGKLVKNLSGKLFKIARSGFRNMPSTTIASFTCLKNPIKNGAIKVDSTAQIIDAKAVVYSDVWGMPIASWELEPVPGCIGAECLKSFLISAFAMKSWSWSWGWFSGAFNGGKPAIFATQQDGWSAGTIMNLARSASCASNSCTTCNTSNGWTYCTYGSDECISNFFSGNSAYSYGYSFPMTQANYTATYNSSTYTIDYKYRINDNDKAYLGGNEMVFEYVSPDFNDLLNTPGNINQRIEAILWERDLTMVGEDETDCYYEFGDLEDKPLLRIKLKKFPTNDYQCADPVTRTINPYFKGILGNWRAVENYVFRSDRNNTLYSDATPSSANNISNAGIYKNFKPFYSFVSGNLQPSYNPETGVLNTTPAIYDRWISTQTSRFYNIRGEEIESKDALDIYSSAVYGYQQNLPVIVGKNARYPEIGFDGFEDYNFNTACNTAQCNIPNHMALGEAAQAQGAVLDNTKSHSGKYSLRLNNTAFTYTRALNANNYANVDAPILVRGADQSYTLNNNALANGFAPKANKEYILSVWVKDNNPLQYQSRLNITINGVQRSGLSSDKWPIVEGWKRLEIRFNTGSGPNMSISFQATGILQMDDVRIFPADAHVKTYAYDDVTLRLMAEHDENNFSTFYEYDEEGSLIRIKKETDRGIMTIKETRKYIRKRN